MIRLAQLLLLASAGGLWVASRLPWAAVTSWDGLGHPRTITLNGAAWAAALVPMAVLLLAAALAGLAVRGTLLRVVGVLLAVVSLAMGYLGTTLMVMPDVGPRGAELAEVPVATLVDSQRHLGGAAVTLVAAVGVLVAATLMMRAGSADSAGRAAKYAATAAPGPEEMSERGMWDALDEGHDPTRDTEGR